MADTGTCYSETIISQHGSPRPFVRRVTAGLLEAGLIFAVMACAGQILLALATHGWLFCGTALFTLILVIPLLMRTVLHPEIVIAETGFYVQPILWRKQFVSWRCIAGITAHPLVYDDAVMGRVLHGKRYRRREGIVVVVKPEAGLLPVYRLIGGLAGAGNVPAFGLSSTTHTEYEALVATIRAHVAASPD